MTSHGLNSLIIKFSSSHIQEVLTFFFNDCLVDNNIFPSQLKMSKCYLYIKRELKMLKIIFDLYQNAYLI